MPSRYHEPCAKEFVVNIIFSQKIPPVVGIGGMGGKVVVVGPGGTGGFVPDPEDSSPQQSP